MSDKELLELAAKAAGKRVDGFTFDGWVKTAETELGEQYYTVWNPLLSDGDALQLAVKLNLEIVPEEGQTIAVCRYVNGKQEALTVDYGDDRYAATRRAIVRAAAEIGRSTP